MSIRSGPFPYLGRGCIVVLTMVFIIVTYLSASSARSAVSSVVSPVQTVNHALKGDRLPLRRTEKLGFSDHKLPVGCEPVSSPLTDSPSAHIARNCLS
jgi:hypothetical protein